MRIELGLAPGPKARSFADYLNAGLRAELSGYSASASFAQDGSFVSAVTGAISVHGQQQVLSWSLSKGPDGTLAGIEVQASDGQTEGPWIVAAHRIVTSALAAALSERVQRFFRRRFLFYIGPQLDGEYWLPGLRLAPAWPDDPQPHLINAERVLAVDTDFDAIDDMHAHAVSQEMTRRTAARLSLLLDVGLYEPPLNQIWVFEDDPQTGQMTSSRRQPGFTRPDIIVTKMPEKGETCPPGRYSGSLKATFRVAGEALSLPPEARRILRGVDSQGPSVSDAFDRCARLYHVALVVGAQFPSVALAYRVAAIDAVVQGNPQFAGFSDFVRKNVQPRDGLEAALDFLYASCRSAHFHGGHFPMGEYARPHWFDPMMDPSDVGTWEISRTAHQLVREAIVAWLYSVTPQLAEGPDSSREPESPAT